MAGREVFGLWVVNACTDRILQYLTETRKKSWVESWAWNENNANIVE